MIMVMTETRGRLTAAEKKAHKVERVLTHVGDLECEHAGTPQPANTHGACGCCKRKVAVVGHDKRGRPVCRDCDDGGPELPKHVSFRNVVVMSPSVGVCMFCSAPDATFVFDTGEPICSRCIG